MMESMSQKSSQYGVVHIPVILAIVLAGSLLVSANVKVSQKFSSSQNVQGVLAQRGSSGQSNANPGQGNSGKSNAGSENRGGVSQEVRLKQEIRTSNERIKTEVRQDQTRTDLSQG